VIRLRQVRESPAVIEHNRSTALHCNAIVSQIDDVDDRAPTVRAGFGRSVESAWR
jgi:hypothetical protein